MQQQTEVGDPEEQLRPKQDYDNRDHLNVMEGNDKKDTDAMDSDNTGDNKNTEMKHGVGEENNKDQTMIDNQNLNKTDDNEDPGHKNSPTKVVEPSKREPVEVSEEPSQKNSPTKGGEPSERDPVEVSEEPSHNNSPTKGVEPSERDPVEVNEEPSHKNRPTKGVELSERDPVEASEDAANAVADLQMGNTKLHVAAMNFDLELVEKLVKTGSSVNKSNKKFRTAVHEMVLSYISLDSYDQAYFHKRFLDILRFLLLNGLDVNETDIKGRTPLHYMVAYPENTDVIKVLLAGGVRINLPDSLHQTSLHLAVARGDMETVRTLVEAGADPNIKNCTGQTALHIAAKGKLFFVGSLLT